MSVEDYHYAVVLILCYSLKIVLLTVITLFLRLGVPQTNVGYSKLEELKLNIPSKEIAIHIKNFLDQ